MKVETVFFDVGGVLEDRSAVDREIVPISAEVLAACGVGSVNEADVVAYRTRLTAALGDRPWENRYFYWRDLIEAVSGSRPSDDVVDRAYGIYLDAYSSRVQIHVDVKPALQMLKSLPVELALISNATMAKTKRFLARVALTKSFTAAVISEEVGSSKPSPVIFSYALYRTGRAPGACMHVGDGLRNDYLAAESAGMVGVLLNRRPSESERNGEGSGARRRIHSLTELAGLIEEIS